MKAAPGGQNALVRWCLIACLLIACASLSMGCASRTKAVAPPLKDELGPFNLIYLANSLPICSSLTPEHCLKPDTFQAVQYRLSREAINKVRDWPFWSAPRAQVKTILLSVLEQALGASEERLFSEKELEALLEPVVDKTSQSTFAELLSEEERSYLKFALAPQQFRDRQANLLETAPSDSRTVYEDIIKVAANLARNNEKKPLIAVISAGSSHPLAAGAYYSEVLKQAGAKVIWLPIEPMFNQYAGGAECAELATAFTRYYGIEQQDIAQFKAMTDKQNFYCRQKAILTSLLHSANAVYFTGEHGSSLMESLFNGDGEGNTYYQLIRRRFLRGTMLLAGANPALLTLAYQGRDMRIAAMTEDYSGMDFYFDKGKELDGIICRNPTHCLNMAGTRRTTNNTRQAEKERGLVFSRHIETKVTMASLLRNMINSDRDFGVGLMRNSAILLSHPNFGRIALKNLTQAKVLVVDNVDADLDVGRRRVDIEDGLIHLLGLNDSFTYSYVTKNMFVTLSGFASGPNDVADSQDIILRDINEKNAFTGWLKEFVLSPLSETRYQDERVDFNLRKSTVFNLLFQAEGGQVKFSNLEYNVRFDKK